MSRRAKDVSTKILHVTDIHLGRWGDKRFGADQHERLAACIASVNAEHGDAAICILTGDLADRGDEPAYENLRKALASLSVPYRLLPGNHDRRAALRSIFPDLLSDANGFLQSAYDVPHGRLIFLDTLDEGRGEGALCDRRLGWLEAQLAEAKGRPVLIFMHHPPVAIGLPYLDPLSLVEPGPFLEILGRHENVAHLFFGHVHRTVSGVVAGIPFAAQRGLHCRFALDFENINETVEDAQPSYGVILLRADGTVVVHSHDFLGRSPRYSATTGEAL